MNTAQRYPLPLSVGVVFGVAFGALLGWWLWEPGREIWAVGAGAVLALVLGSLLGVLVWSRARLLCGWVVCMVPDSWDAHAHFAGLLTTGRQGASGHRERMPLKVAKIKARPRIKSGALWVPVKTTEGGLNRKNAEKLADELAAVLCLSAARVKIPQGRKNAGFFWFILSAEDMTA